MDPNQRLLLQNAFNEARTSYEINVDSVFICRMKPEISLVEFIYMLELGANPRCWDDEAFEIACLYTKPDIGFYLLDNYDGINFSRVYEKCLESFGTKLLNMDILERCLQIGLSDDIIKKLSQFYYYDIKMQTLLLKYGANINDLIGVVCGAGYALSDGNLFTSMVNRLRQSRENKESLRDMLRKLIEFIYNHITNQTIAYKGKVDNLGAFLNIFVLFVNNINLDQIALLIDMGADPHFGNGSVLESMCKKKSNNLQLIESFVQTYGYNGSTSKAISNAIINKHTDIADYLFNLGAPIDDACIDACLMRIDCIDILVNFGIDPERISNRFLETSLSAPSDSIKKAKYLIGLGVDFNKIILEYDNKN